MKLLPVSRRFEKIYRERHWGGPEAESASGRGSSLEATETIRAYLPQLFEELQVNKLLDLGCGDFNWMRHVDLNVDYLGADIVPEVIHRNDQLYSKPGVEFCVLDGSKDPIPPDVDAVLCREVLFHLSFDHGLSLIRNLKASNAKYLIATQIYFSGANRDIYTGGFRQLDLRKQPFNFPEPLRTVPDDTIAANRSLCVWRLDELEVD